MAYVTYQDGGGHVASEVESSVKVGAVVKIISLFGFVVILLVFLFVRKVFLKPGVSSVSITDGIGGLEFRIPYKNTLYENFGFVQDPRVTIPLKTTSGYKDTTFLLDSGAVVSTMPLQVAHDTGVDLARAKRITLQGFSGVPSFAYLDEITVMIGDSEYVLPASFTESSSTTHILGRKGLFDDFTIKFDHEDRAIIITRKDA
jgi:hypothetical protein